MCQAHSVLRTVAWPAKSQLQLLSVHRHDSAQHSVAGAAAGNAAAGDAAAIAEAVLDITPAGSAADGHAQRPLAAMVDKATTTAAAANTAAAVETCILPKQAFQAAAGRSAEQVTDNPAAKAAAPHAAEAEVVTGKGLSSTAGKMAGSEGLSEAEQGRLRLDLSSEEDFLLCTQRLPSSQGRQHIYRSVCHNCPSAVHGPCA